MKFKAMMLAGAAALSLTMLAGLTPASAQDVTVDQIMGDADSVGDVVSYGLGPRAQHVAARHHLRDDHRRAAAQRQRAKRQVADSGHWCQNNRRNFRFARESARHLPNPIAQPELGLPCGTLRRKLRPHPATAL